MNEWLRQTLGHPQTITEAIRQVIGALVLFHVLEWTADQTAGFMMAASAVLALFARQTTVSTSRVDLITDKKAEQKAEVIVAQRMGTGTGTGTGSGFLPPGI